MFQGEGSHKPRSQIADGGAPSALSRSMRYADPWLYGSVRGAPNGLVLAPAFMLCTCPDYVNGTKRSSKKSPTTCKKCKRTRLPLSSNNESPKFGTVRCYPTTNHQTTGAATPLRAGTMRATSSSARPSILPTTQADPYDLMRRSRLSSDSQFRARSISPGKVRGNELRNHSSASVIRGANKQQHISSPNKNDPAFHSNRRSILECDINPYELMSSDEAAEVRDASITLVNGQRIRVRPKSISSDYEDVQIVGKKPHPSINNSTLKLQPNKNNKISSPKLSEKESDSTISNRFKSILKKSTTTTTTFSDTDLNSRERSPSPARKSGTHFYLPMPGGNTPIRKKVQFLVENETVFEAVNNNYRTDEESINEENNIVESDDASSLEEQISDNSAIDVVTTSCEEDGKLNGNTSI